MKVYLHVNYYEGPGKIDTLFKLAAMNRYDGVELRYKYQFPDMDARQYREKLIALKSKYPEMDIYFGGMVDFHQPDRATVQKETDAYIEFLQWSSRNLGTRIMNFFTGSMVRPGAGYMDFEINGSGMADDEHYRWSAEGLKVVGDAAAALGMRIALETHNCYLHDLAAPCKRLMDLTNHPAVGINYDHGNIILNKKGESIEKVFELVGDKIYHTHLKNVFVSKGLFFVTHLEQGQIDTFEVVKRLKDRGYAGALCVEYPCPGDGVIAAKRDKEYVDYIKEFLEID